MRRRALTYMAAVMADVAGVQDTVHVLKYAAQILRTPADSSSAAFGTIATDVST